MEQHLVTWAAEELGQLHTELLNIGHSAVYPQF